jgi:ketosteroid isomerase-like protein
MTTAQNTTSVQENNVAQVRKGYEAFGAGDLASLKELFHPDAVWNVPATGVITGNYRGRDAIFAFFAQTQRNEPHFSR